MIRLIPDLSHGPMHPEELVDVNVLIQARIDRRISRRGLIQRALQLGIAAPVVGVMLHATSDLVRGAPNSGRANATRTLFQDGQILPATAPTQPAGTPIEGGTIVIGTNEEPDTLHPYLTQLATGFDVYSGITELFLTYDSTQQLMPQLAESFEISPDGLTYTFKLRSGVTFHNGDPLTGQDVVESWKMIMNPEFAAWSTLGWDQITDITVADDGLTCTVVTGAPYAPFLSYLSANNAICPSSAMAKGIDSFKQEYGRAPFGTGPLKFVEWKSKERIVLERNPNHWGGAPKLEQVIFSITPDDNTQLVQLQTGEIQMVGGAGAFGAIRVDDVLKLDTVVVLEHDTQSWNHLDLKHVDHLRMTKVRQALDFATPTQTIIDQLLKGRATRSTGDIAPISWAYNPNITPRAYEPEKAKALLTEAGLTQGDDGWSGPTPAPTNDIDPNTQPATGPVKPLEIEIWAIAGDSQTERVAQVIAQAWNEVGIKTVAKFEDVSTIFGPEGFQFNDKMTAGMYSWYNGNDPADESYYWSSSQIPNSPTGSGGNTPAYFYLFNFQDKIDELTDAAVKEVDQVKRKELYAQTQELLYEEVPVIFLYWSRNYEVAAKNVGGFWPSSFNNLLWNVGRWYLAQ